MARRRSSGWNASSFRRLGTSLVQGVLITVPFVILFGVIAFLMVGVKGMLHADPYFQVTRVTVFPSGILSESEIRFLETATRDRNLIEINLKDMSQKLERNPRVKRAEVRRIFPQDINIMVTPREPLLQVQFRKNGRIYVVGRDQVVMSVSQHADPELIVLEDFSASKKSYSPGTLYQRKHFERVSELLATLQNDPVLRTESVSRVGLDRLGNWTLILSDGIEIRLGKDSDLSQEKRTVLKTILKSKERGNLLYIDTRYQDILIKNK